MIGFGFGKKFERHTLGFGRIVKIGLIRSQFFQLF